MYTKYNTILLKVDASKEDNRMIQTQLSDLSEFATCLIFIYLFFFFQLTKSGKTIYLKTPDQRYQDHNKGLSKVNSGLFWWHCGEQLFSSWGDIVLWTKQLAEQTRSQMGRLRWPFQPYHLHTKTHIYKQAPMLFGKCNQHVWSHTTGLVRVGGIREEDGEELNKTEKNTDKRIKGLDG